MFSRTIETADGALQYYSDYGPRDGPPIALVHGMGAAGRQFGADADYFAARGYRVLVPDLRGHGASRPPEPIAARDFTIGRLAQDMLAMLDDAGVERIDWVGNSLGGIVALEMLASSAARFASLATFGTAYALNLPRLADTVIPLAYRLPGPGITARLTALTTTPVPEGRRMVESLLRAFDPRVGGALTQNIRRYDLIANALAYDGPILLIRGGRDVAVNAALPKTLRAMRAHGDFEMVEMPRAGHCANLDAPAEIRRLLERFWARGPAR